MFRRCSQLLLLLLSGWLLAGPLAFLQLGAWGWMLASYSQESSFEQAIVETFGNNRPCNLCGVIDAVEESESANRSPQHNDQKDIKLMLGLSRAIKLIVPTSVDAVKTPTVCELENAHRRVPTPPPKAA